MKSLSTGTHRRRARRLLIEQFERRNLLTTLELLPVADSTLYEDLSGSTSNGAGEHFFAGTVAPRGGVEKRRGLIRFDLEDLPANATINSVNLELSMSRTIAGDQPVSVHRVLTDWGEGNSDAPDEEGKGTTALLNDSTWLHRHYPVTTWATAGGDFTPLASSTIQVGGNGRYTWSSAQMITDVTNWVADASDNHGWMVVGNELTLTTAKRFDTRENSTPANRPMLVIDFDLPDSLKPTPIISGPSSPTGSDPFDVSIAFAETVTGFTADDLTVSNGSVTNLVDNGGGTFTATIDAASDGNVTVDIAADVAADLAGNTNFAAAQFSVMVDTMSPTPTIAGPSSPTNSELFDITITFGETVSGFVAGDVTVSNGSVTNLVDSGGGTFKATIDVVSEGNVTIDVFAGAAVDGAGNSSNAAARLLIIVDNTDPAPTITGPTSPTSSDPLDVTIDFAEAVTGFTVGDITVANGSVTNLVDNGAGNFTATIDATTDGVMTVDVAAGVAADLAGNTNLAAEQISLVVDTIKPTATITGPSSPTSSDPFDVTIVFSEIVTGFVAGDITVSNGSVSQFVDNDGGSFTATIDAISDGAVIVVVASNAATDEAGNGNTAATQFPITVDTMRPVPMITAPATETALESFDVTIDFAETVTGFIADDIAVGNGTVTNLVDNGVGNYTATIDAGTDGPVTIDIGADIAADAAGNSNTAATQFSITVDTTGPTPTISGPANPTNGNPFDVTIDFGEAVTAFVAADITVSNGSVSNLVDNGDGNFTASIDADADGIVAIDIAADVAADLVGNSNFAAAPFAITVDTASPTPSITGPASPTNTEPFDVMIDFGESMANFIAADITVGNGTVTLLVDNDGGNFTATIDPTVDGDVMVDIGADVATDIAGNPNLASGQFLIAVDTAGPTPSIIGPSGTISNRAFQVTVAFAEPVTGFVVDDLTVANGSVTNLRDNGDGNFVVAVSAVGDGDVTVDIPADVATDAAGNANNAATQFSVTLDTTGPTPTITGPADPTHLNPFSVVIDFAESVTGFSATDISVGNGSVTSLVDQGGGGFTAAIAADADGTVTIDIDAGVAEDLVGNTSFIATQFSITVDTTRPTPTITGPVSPSSSDPFDVTIDFGETMIDFVDSDITVSNGSVIDLVDNGNGIYTATIDTTADGHVTVDIAADVAIDADDNNNHPAEQFAITIDTTPPVPSITGPGSPVMQDTLDVTIDFGESISGFDAGDVIVGNGSIIDFVDNGGGSFNATIEATENGDVTVDVAADAAVDGAGNANNAATQYVVTVAFNLDYGDAPTAAQSGFANNYPVRFAENGARHSVGSLRLGNVVDVESDGLPTADASGDGADDDGVGFVTSVVAAQAATTSSLSVIATGSGMLDAWIDFNQDGDWDDADEQIVAGASVSEIVSIVSFTVPADAANGATGARLRLSSGGGLTPNGPADDGEVEDYMLTVLSGDSSPEVAINMVDHLLSVSNQSGEVVVRSGQALRFQAPAANVDSLNVVGTSSNDSVTLDLGSGFEVPAGGLKLDGGGGNNTLLIAGADGAIDLSDPAIDASNLAKIDLSDIGPTALTVDAAAVVKLAPASNLIEIVAVEGDQIVVREAANWRMTDPIIVDNLFYVTATHQEGDDEKIQARVPHAWQNFVRHGDVTNDGSVTSLDALVIINELGRQKYRKITGPDLLDAIDVAIWPGLYFDQNGDDRATALDALRVINELAVQGSGGENVEAEFVPSVLPIVSDRQRGPGRSSLDQPSTQSLMVRSEAVAVTNLAPGSAGGRSVIESPQEASSTKALAIGNVDALFADDAFLSNGLPSSGQMVDRAN